MSDIREKIKKLLALGQNNTNENEAARAMEFASKLMMEHGIAEDQLGGEKPSVKQGAWFNIEYAWYTTAAHAAARLYAVKPVQTKSKVDVKYAFVGRPQNIEAAEDTLAFIVLQVEAQYKFNLPKGLSKQERAAYRKSFKIACATRVYQRACDIADHQQQPTSSTAIVLHRSELTREVDEYLHANYKQGRKEKARTQRLDRGYFDGKRAGDNVDLHRTVN